MSKYIVDGTELTSVANAIRTKGGTNSPLVFPNGFVSAVNNISGGGGGGSSDFSTAEVTVINNAKNNFILAMPNIDIINNDLYSSIDSEDITEDPMSVPMYKGSLNLSAEPAVSTNGRFFGYAGTGGVSVTEHGEIVITGDGTLTITDANA